MVAEPVKMRTAASETCAAKSQPQPTPITAPGMMTASTRPLQSLR